MSEEIWSKGKTGGCVITDTPDGLNDSSGHAGSDANLYYGGALIAESIWRPKDVALISAAPELLKCLKEAIESVQLETNNVPQKWIDAVKKAETI
jgi:hypothetical protein